MWKLLAFGRAAATPKNRVRLMHSGQQASRGEEQVEPRRLPRQVYAQTHPTRTIQPEVAGFSDLVGSRAAARVERIGGRLREIGLDEARSGRSELGARSGRTSQGC